MIKFDVDLTAEERDRIAETNAEDWFTSVQFGDTRSPRHPRGANLLDANNEMKQRTVADWIERVAPDSRVLDAFCANGAFSFMAARAGAREVVGFDFEQPRVDIATLTADLLAAHDHDLPVRFEQLDVYSTADQYQGETFDVVMALGGLYHIADPPHILRQLRQVTGEWLIVQTTQIVPLPGSYAKFYFRADRRSEGLSSVRAGEGVWKYTTECFRNLIRHGGFEIVEERQPALRDRRRFPWYSALCRAV